MFVRSLKITLPDVQNSFDILFLQRILTNDANKQNIESKNRQHYQSIHLRWFLFLKSWQNPWKINVKEFAVSKVVGSRSATLLKKLFHRYFSNMFGKYLWWSSVLIMLQASGLQFYWKTTLSQELSKDFAKIIQETPSPNFIHGIVMGYSRKKTKQGGGWLETYIFELPLEFFIFFTLPLEISEKIKLHPWKFHKIVLHLLEIPRPKTKTTGNSSLFFLGHPWKFYFVLTPGNSTCYFFDTLSSAPLPCLFFSGVAHGLFWKKNKQ